MVVNKNNSARVNRGPGPALPAFPSSGICYLCASSLNREEFFLCRDCKNDLPFNDRACPVCAAPVSGGATWCGSCVEGKEKPVGNTLAMLRYVFPVNRLIHDLKFDAHIEIAFFLGRGMAEYAGVVNFPLPDCLIPIPLHRSRIRERGYNQSLEIARAIGRELKVPVDNDSCKRIINTPPQSAVTAALREKNIKGSFVLSGRRKKLPGHVALIDDVITTGSTVNELARLLLDGGVARVDAWAAARTEKTNI